MKRIIGIVAYLLLVTSSVFIDAPIISIFVMPLFLLGIILLMVFHLTLIQKNQKSRWLNIILAFLGSLMLCGILGYAAVEYNQYQVQIDMNMFAEGSYVNWLKVIIVAGVNLLGTFLIYLGIRTSDKVRQDNIFHVLLPTILLIPLTLFLITITVLTGIWFGG